jgi:hypothetical protein
MRVAASAVRDFQRDGAVCVRGAVAPEHVSLAWRKREADLADLSPRAKRASGADDAAFVDARVRPGSHRGDWYMPRSFLDRVPGPHRRRVPSVRCLGDDVVHAPRPWTTSPPFDGLDIPPGAPMDDPLFPVLWTAV